MRRRASLSACAVPLLGRCVDLAYTTDEGVFTVEFKLRDWRQALRQARDHLLAADYAYVCMPARRISQDLREQFTVHGIGLFFYVRTGDWPFEVVIEAKPSSDIWTPVRESVISYMSSGRGSRASR